MVIDDCLCGTDEKLIENVDRKNTKERDHTEDLRAEGRVMVTDLSEI